MKSQFGKYRKCYHVELVVCAVFMVAVGFLCCYACLRRPDLQHERWYVYAWYVLGGIAVVFGTVTSLLLRHYSKCPHCGKPLRWYKPVWGILCRKPVRCFHCNVDVETK